MQDKRDAERWPPLAHEHVELLALCCCEKGNTAICVCPSGGSGERDSEYDCVRLWVSPPRICSNLANVSPSPLRKSLSPKVSPLRKSLSPNVSPLRKSLSPNVSPVLKCLSPSLGKHTN